MKEDCCGCRGCEQACPKAAITMVQDPEKGFLYPKIDYNLCVKCGICDQVCGFTEENRRGREDPVIYAVKHKCENIRKESTSGGVFTAISDVILQMNGCVYGAAYDEKLNVVHKRATTKEQSNAFRGSKYVQSDIGNTYLQVQQDLCNGRYVLFSGTPCQVSGLTKFLGQAYDKLITVDVLCHGVPSPKLWQEFLSIMGKKAKARVVAAKFRDKTNSWLLPKTTLYYENGQSGIYGENGYFQLFHPNFMLRESCYNCQFRSFKRPSDITIADFWGIKDTMPELDDDRGVSLIFVNSQKGEWLFNAASNDIEAYKSFREACRQDQITGAVKKNKRYEEFWADYRAKGLKFVLVKYTEFSYLRTVIKKCNCRLKRYLKIK